MTAEEVDEQGVELERRLKHLCEAALALRDAQLAATRTNRYLEEALIAERDAYRRVDEQLRAIRVVRSARGQAGTAHDQRQARHRVWLQPDQPRPGGW